jgi:hypothetical protein
MFADLVSITLAVSKYDLHVISEVRIVVCFANGWFKQYLVGTTEGGGGEC